MKKSQKNYENLGKITLQISNTSQLIIIETQINADERRFSDGILFSIITQQSN